MTGIISFIKPEKKNCCTNNPEKGQKEKFVFCKRSFELESQNIKGVLCNIIKTNERRLWRPLSITISKIEKLF